MGSERDAAEHVGESVARIVLALLAAAVAVWELLPWFEVDPQMARFFGLSETPFLFRWQAASWRGRMDLLSPLGYLLLAAACYSPWLQGGRGWFRPASLVAVIAIWLFACAVAMVWWLCTAEGPVRVFELIAAPAYWHTIGMFLPLGVLIAFLRGRFVRVRRLANEDGEVS